MPDFVARIRQELSCARHPVSCTGWCFAYVCPFFRQQCSQHSCTTHRAFAYLGLDRHCREIRVVRFIRTLSTGGEEADNAVPLMSSPQTRPF